MSEKSYLTQYEMSSRQAATLCLAIPPRFIKAFDVLPSQHATELIHSSTLLDLWLLRVLQTRMHPGDCRISVQYPDDLSEEHRVWIRNTLAGVGKFARHGAGGDKYHDVRIASVDYPLVSAESFFARIVLTNSGGPFCFVINGVLSHWRVNYQEESAKSKVQYFLNALYRVRHSEPV